jgi:hypothetical protein
MAQAANKAEADTFGRNHLPHFCESIEVDIRSRADAEEFWGVTTVRLVRVVLDPEARAPKKPALLDWKTQTTPVTEKGATVKHVWVRGPQLPEEVETGGALTPEDHRDLTVDHITRTSEIMAQVQILKWAR